MPFKHYLLLLIALSILSSITYAADRVALVIGNNDYTQKPLKNPVNDARAIGRALKKMNFKVVDAYNVNRDGIEDALVDFGQQAERAEIAIIYYAGHAIQVDGRNYLIPANTPVKERRDLRKLIDLKELVSEAQQARGLGLVMLDACRDNPFSANLAQNLGRSIGGRGLARVEDTPRNILVAFATKENAIAADGQGKHSPYAQALLTYLPQANLEVRLLFGKVRDAVEQATGQRQKPYTYGTLGGSEWFLAGSKQPPPPRPPSMEEPEMVAIEGGCFQMGQSAVEKKWLKEQGGNQSDERQHKVCIKPFWLAKNEITVGDFRRFSTATGYKTDAEKDSAKGCYAWKDKKWQWVKGRNWQKVGFQQTDNHPVACVSWNDAQAYTQWLKKETGKSYRLPTEAEWEYAARAGTKTMRYWGDDKDNKAACRYANVADKKTKQKYSDWSVFDCNDGYTETSPVGRFVANNWGLNDMLGNVWEWTCSAYEKDYDGSESVCANENDSRSRVLRGGSWDFRPLLVRSANRYWSGRSNRYSLVGFRLARTR